LNPTTKGVSPSTDAPFVEQRVDVHVEHAWREGPRLGYRELVDRYDDSGGREAGDVSDRCSSNDTTYPSRADGHGKASRPANTEDP
jgi:hypothetical protein